MELKPVKANGHAVHLRHGPVDHLHKTVDLVLN